MYTNTFDGTDPEAYMGNWVCDEVSGPDNQWLGNNITRWCEKGNAEYQALIDELAVTVDLNSRAEMIKTLNDMIVQDYAMIPLVTRGDVSAVHNTLLGVRFNVWDSELWNIADWSRASQ
jgi:peptide/nickel transport system substrate-binding protein